VTFLATTLVSLYRGGSTNDYGDEVDDNTTADAEHIPASVIEQRQTIADPTTGTPRTVRVTVGRVRSGVDVRTGDRLRDERSGDLYVVEGVAQPASPVAVLDQRLDLSRVS
jgi:hypothetical protein